MMPGVGFAEMVLLVLVGIVVIGPKELPLMMRKFGRFTGKMRALAFEFKQGFDELGRQAELDELRKEVADLKKHTGLSDLGSELEQDRINMEKDIASAMAPVDTNDPNRIAPPVTSVTPELPPAETASTETAPKETGETPPASTHVADAGEDFHIDGPAPEPKPAPAKQDAPA